jgi:coproporphyrinogen III oxidase
MNIFISPQENKYYTEFNSDNEFAYQIRYYDINLIYTREDFDLKKNNNYKNSIMKILDNDDIWNYEYFDYYNK